VEEPLRNITGGAREDAGVQAGTLMHGASAEFHAVLRSAQLVAVTDAPVLLFGKSGTGKELLAHAIHAGSPRRQGPMVAVNCAALPDALAEGELFGYTKGAFTGAMRNWGGRIAAAHRGTLFLDEVGELPLPIQSKLLRFLESGECQPLGTEHPCRVDARIIAATNRDLMAMVRQGSFREDLFYRLHVVPLHLPALRDRTGDIGLLTRQFLTEFASQYRVPCPGVSARSWSILQRYPWPGNVRELRNVCERLVILQPAGGLIQPCHLPEEIMRGALLGADGDTTTDAGATPSIPFTMPEGGVDMEALEREVICQALLRTQGNRTLAARLLRISRDALLYRMKKYAMRP
jgi:transcriptional regulator with PAS, ATPase and Fis domain